MKSTQFIPCEVYLLEIEIENRHVKWSKKGSNAQVERIMEVLNSWIKFQISFASKKARELQQDT